MIATLRRRHRAAFVILAAVLPLLFLLALLVRRTVPTVDRVPVPTNSETAAADG